MVKWFLGSYVRNCSLRVTALHYSTTVKMGRGGFNSTEEMKEYFFTYYQAIPKLLDNKLRFQVYFLIFKENSELNE